VTPLAIASPFFASPLIGLVSIPASMILSTLLFEPIVAVRVRHMFAIRTIHRRDLFLIAFGTLLLSAYATTRSTVFGFVTCAILIAIALYCVVSAGKSSGRNAVSKDEA
jgi:hypothetical protein